MWWNGPGWGHVYGWWFMPLFGIVCMVIFLYVISRIFGSGGFCGKYPLANDQGNMDELKNEIRELREEVKVLKGNKKSEE